MASRDPHGTRTGTVALPFCHITLRGRKPLPAAYPRELKTLGDHLRKRRLDLGLLQRQVAERIGVRKDTVCTWELNRAAPETRFFPAILGFLGYAPYDPAWSPGQRLAACRQALGLSQGKLARIVGVDESTVRRWERARGSPQKKLLDRVEAQLRSLFALRG